MASRLRIAIEGASGPPAVYVAEGGNVLAADPGEVGGTLAPGADDADIDFFTGRFTSLEDAEAAAKG